VEILRNLLGSLGSGLIRLLVAVGIIAAVGYFVVRPVLDKAGDITRETNQTIRKGVNRGFGSNGAGLEDVDKTLQEVNKTVEREIKKSFHFAEKHGAPASPKRLIKCIQRADGNPHRIQHCTVKF